MHPLLFRAGPIDIYSYGVMVAIGFCIVVFLAYRRAADFGIDRKRIVDYLVAIFISGLVGARIFFVLLNYGYYEANPSEILNLSKGGLVWYGGFIAAALVSIWYMKRVGLDFWAVADLMAPYIALGQAFGRIGCLLNGCCYGAPAPDCLTFGGRYPTQILSAILLVIIFAVLVRRQSKRRFKGEIFALYCILYSCKRFLIEFLRGDNPGLLFGLTVSQLISIGILLAGVLIYKKMADECRRKVSPGSR